MEKIFLPAVFIVLSLTLIVWLSAVLHERIVRERRWRAAGRELPELSRRLGLSVPRVSGAGDVGEIKGRFRGHDLRIIPGSSFVNLGLDRPVACYVSQKRPVLERLLTPRASPGHLFIHEPGSARPAGVVPFSAGDGSFDRFLAHRFAAAGIVPKMNRAHAAFAPFADFIRRHGGKLKYFEIDSKNIRFAFRRGRFKAGVGSHGYIMAAELEAVLADLPALAAFLEDVGKYE